MTDLRSSVRRAVSPYAESSDRRALLLLAADLSGYTACLALIFLFENLFLWAVAGVFAGVFISSLFTIAHDSAHQSFTGRRWLNSLIGRIAFLPSLHNYTLWLREHNRAHHWAPNVKGLNSWSPLTKAEFDALSPWRQSMVRLIRSPLGPGLYYISARWWRAKFFPRPSEKHWKRKTAWADFALLVIFVFAFLGGLVWLSTVTNRDPWLVIVFGAVLPFLLWNFLMGTTVYLHHTHPRVPWFKTPGEADGVAEQMDLTVHVKFPRWYGVLTHNIMEHTAHHVNARIPCYYLDKAQSALEQVLGPRVHTERASLRYILDVFRTCKLYDYDRHRWLTFGGKETQVVVTGTKAAVAN